MKNRYAILLFSIACLLLSCNKSLQSVSQSREAVAGTIQTIEVIDVTAFEKAVTKENVQLIDVRTQKEWQEGHLKNAKRFEINNPNWDEQIATLDKTKPVYVYCAKGVRSARSAKQLKRAGFVEVYDLKGGITAWKEAGKPIK